MIYKEEYRDLFTLPGNYILAHCVSRDLAMGAGIAKVFRDKYAIKKALTHRSTVPNSTYQAFGYGECLFTVTPESPWLVGNLITKERYWEKPTYDRLRTALNDFRDGIQRFFAQGRDGRIYDIKIGMPLIGCGLDRLEWGEVSKIINQVFVNTNYEILICRKD